MFRLNSSKWEKKCTHCGICCHEKVILGDEVLVDCQTPCEFYDQKKHRCNIYVQRLEINPRCLKVTVLRAMFARYLPDECAYVQWARQHHLRFALKRKFRFITGVRGNTDSEDPDSALVKQL
jgi:hypothetical protein